MQLTVAAGAVSWFLAHLLDSILILVFGEWSGDLWMTAKPLVVYHNLIFSYVLENDIAKTFTKKYRSFHLDIG